MKNIDYSKLTEITLRTQAELDAIPLSFKGMIYVDCGSHKIQVRNRYYLPVVVLNNSHVVACGNSSVLAKGKSVVEARDRSAIEALENSFVVALDKSGVVARDNSSVVARDLSSVVATGNSSIEAWDKSWVSARDNSSIEAWDKSYVAASGNSHVVALGNYMVIAIENSSVEARGNSWVEAKGNSFVVARDSSSVEGYGNSQIINQTKGKVRAFGNARIVYPPQTIREFMDFYEIEHDNKKAVFYKAVHKDGDIYRSDYNSNFIYKIGETVKGECDPNNEKDCSTGIHISHLDWALNYGGSWSDLAILELETDIKDIVLPLDSDGKVRTSKAKVLREVPLEEWGLCGKIIARVKKKENYEIQKSNS